jgi:hypothetical protein
VILRTTVGTMCYGDNELNHLQEIIMAEQKAAKCRAQCGVGR